MVGIGSGFLTLLQSLYILLQLPERAIRGIASLDDRRIASGALVFERRGIQRISQFIAIPLLILFTESLELAQAFGSASASEAWHVAAIVARGEFHLQHRQPSALGQREAQAASALKATTAGRQHAAFAGQSFWGAVTTRHFTKQTGGMVSVQCFT